jgi:hypothetical protein
MPRSESLQPVTGALSLGMNSLDSGNPAERAVPTSLRNCDEKPRNSMRIGRIYPGRDRSRNFAAIVVSPRRPSLVPANSRSMSLLQGGL